MKFGKRLLFVFLTASILILSNFVTSVNAEISTPGDRKILVPAELASEPEELGKWEKLFETGCGQIVMYKGEECIVPAYSKFTEECNCKFFLCLASKMALKALFSDPQELWKTLDTHSKVNINITELVQDEDHPEERELKNYLGEFSKKFSSIIEKKTQEASLKNSPEDEKISVIIPERLFEKKEEIEKKIELWGRLAGKERRLYPIQIEGRTYFVPNYDHVIINDFTSKDIENLRAIEGCLSEVKDCNLVGWHVLTEEEMKQFGKFEIPPEGPIENGFLDDYAYRLNVLIKRFLIENPDVKPAALSKQGTTGYKQTTSEDEKPSFGGTHTSSDASSSSKKSSFSLVHGGCGNSPPTDARMADGFYCCASKFSVTCRTVEGGFRKKQHVKSLEPGMKTSVIHFVSEVFDESKWGTSLKPECLYNARTGWTEEFSKKEIEELHPKALEFLKNYYKDVMIDREDSGIILGHMRTLQNTEFAGYCDPDKMRDYIFSLNYKFWDELKKRYEALWKEVRDGIYEMPKETIVHVDGPLEDYNAHKQQMNRYNGSKAFGTLMSGSYIMPKELFGTKDKIWYKLFGENRTAVYTICFDESKNYYVPHLTSMVKTPEGKLVVKNKFEDGHRYADLTNEELAILYEVFKDPDKYKDINNWSAFQFEYYNISADHINSGDVKTDYHLYWVQSRSVSEINTEKARNIDQYIDDMRHAAEGIKKILWP